MQVRMAIRIEGKAFMHLRLFTWLLAVLVWGGLSAAAPAQPKFYALVVGVDAYAHIPALHGAVNDAQLLADALRSAGAAEVKVLVDAQVSRQNVLSGFQGLVAKAAPGDWVILTYAGHGWQEPEQIKPFRHPDGKNNAILLAGFEPLPPGANERIRDFEFAELLAKVPPEVKVLFVADACHSGTLTREIDPRAKGLTYRNTPYGPIENDQLPPEQADTAMTTDEQPNVVYAAAALDTETAPELSFGGKAHGALSWYIAKAIQGDADQNNDGVTTLAEFRSYVTASVRTAAESRQTPDVRYVAGRGTEVLPFARAVALTDAGAHPAAAARPDASDDLQQALKTPLSVAMQGGDGALLKGLQGLVLVPADRADILWDVKKGEVVNRRLADPVAQNIVTGAQFAGVADKWRSLPALYALEAKSPLTVRVAPDGSGKRYAAGAVVTLSAETEKSDLRYFTAFDLAGNGEVELQFPATEMEAAALPKDFRLEFSSKVQPPFGADHLVVIATAEKPEALREALRALANKRAAGDAVRAVWEAVGKRPYALGVAQLYTGP